LLEHDPCRPEHFFLLDLRKFMPWCVVRLFFKFISSSPCFRKTPPPKVRSKAQFHLGPLSFFCCNLRVTVSDAAKLTSGAELVCNWSQLTLLAPLLVFLTTWSRNELSFLHTRIFPFRGRAFPFSVFSFRPRKLSFHLGRSHPIFVPPDLCLLTDFLPDHLYLRRGLFLESPTLVQDISAHPSISALGFSSRVFLDFPFSHRGQHLERSHSFSFLPLGFRFLVVTPKLCPLPTNPETLQVWSFARFRPGLGIPSKHIPICSLIFVTGPRKTLSF